MDGYLTNSGQAVGRRSFAGLVPLVQEEAVPRSGNSRCLIETTLQRWRKRRGRFEGKLKAAREWFREEGARKINLLWAKQGANREWKERGIQVWRKRCTKGLVIFLRLEIKEGDMHRFVENFSLLGERLETLF